MKTNVSPNYRLPDSPRNQAANTDPDELIRSPNAPSTVESIVKTIGGRGGWTGQNADTVASTYVICVQYRDFGSSTGDFRFRAGESNSQRRFLITFTTFPTSRSFFFHFVGNNDSRRWTGRERWRHGSRCHARFFFCVQMNFDIEAFLDYYSNLVLPPFISKEVVINILFL